MNRYKVTFKLYGIWLAISCVPGLLVFFETTSIALSLITHLFTISALYFLLQPGFKKYSYFFNNNGHSFLAAYIFVFSVQTIALILLTSILKLATNA